MAPLNKAQLAERNERIWQMRLRGTSERAIAAEVGLSQARVHDILAEAAHNRTAPTRELLRAQMREQLDALYEMALRDAEKFGLCVSNGRVMFDPRSEQPIEDTGPRMAAIDRLLKIMDRRAKLDQIDEPTQTEMRIAAGPSADAELAEAIREAKAAADGDVPE